MPKLDIEFAWPVAVLGYELREIGSETFLVARGDERRWHNPIAFHPALFRLFASLPERPAAYTDFASKFGLLFGPHANLSMIDRSPEQPTVYVEGDVTHRDSVDVWLHHVRRFRRLVTKWDRARQDGAITAPDYRDLLPHPRLIVDLVDRAAPPVLAPAVPTPDAKFGNPPKPGLSFRPDCLLSALDLQFYQAVSGMTELRECQHCGTWFECGPGGVRRSASRFCSDKCRFDFHNQRKGKGASR